MNNQKEWFETWFDSPYYHILYDHRDEQEAEKFIFKLKEHLQLGVDDKILDLGCGAGRHAAFLANYAGEAIGVDLSENSIITATASYPRPNLEFYKHDMRYPFRINYFNYILNFFTSFGYFKKMSDNIRVLESAYKGLRPGGTLLIDFMNAEKVKMELKADETVEKQGITFTISRKIQEGKILKSIHFEIDGDHFAFEESVQALSRDDFHLMARKTGFDIIEEFGDYDLNEYDADRSPRYILRLEKPHN